MCIFQPKKIDHINENNISKQSIRNMHHEFQCFDFRIANDLISLLHSESIWNFQFMFWYFRMVCGLRCTIQLFEWRKENKINTRNVMCFIVLTQAQYSTSIAHSGNIHLLTQTNILQWAHTQANELALAWNPSASIARQANNIHTHTRTQPNPSVNSCSDVELNCLYTLAFYIPFVKLPAKAIILACQTRWLYVTVTYSRTVRSVPVFVFDCTDGFFWKPL